MIENEEMIEEIIRVMQVFNNVLKDTKNFMIKQQEEIAELYTSVKQKKLRQALNEQMLQRLNEILELDKRIKEQEKKIQAMEIFKNTII